jgi:hypothetical protein
VPKFTRHPGGRRPCTRVQGGTQGNPLRCATRFKVAMCASGFPARNGFICRGSCYTPFDRVFLGVRSAALEPPYARISPALKGSAAVLPTGPETPILWPDHPLRGQAGVILANLGCPATFASNPKPVTRPIRVHRRTPDPVWGETGVKEHKRNE